MSTEVQKQMREGIKEIMNVVQCFIRKPDIESVASAQKTSLTAVRRFSASPSSPPARNSCKVGPLEHVGVEAHVDDLDEDFSISTLNCCNMCFHADVLQRSYFEIEKSSSKSST